MRTEVRIDSGCEAATKHGSLSQHSPFPPKAIQTPMGFPRFSSPVDRQLRRDFLGPAGMCFFRPRRLG
jgi:hypothetical protein